MSDELQRRALEVVMQHLGSHADEIETRRDDAWLWLYEGLGWSAGGAGGAAGPPRAE